MAEIEPVRFIYLSQEDVVEIGLSVKDVINCVEQALAEHGKKCVENPPKPGIHPKPEAFLHAMPAYLKNLGISGMKWVSVFPNNYAQNLPSTMGLIVLNDVDNGKPLTIMDCRWITAVRTGAVSAVSAKYLAKKDAEVIGIVGAGVQGRSNLLALKEVLPNIKLAKYFDEQASTLSSAVDFIGKQVSFEVVPVASAEDSIRGSDVIVTATGRLERVIFFEEWVEEGALVLPVHHRGWENRLLHQLDKFVTDDWLQLSNTAKVVGGFDGDLPEPYAELGEIVIGRKAGRLTPKERIVDFNYGLAIEDIVIANKVYLMAKEKGFGQELTLMASDLF